MSDLMQDVRYALRSLLKSRAFTTVVLLTLTVGIGGTVAMYGVLHAALGRALPFPEPNRLVLGEATINGVPNPMVSFPDYLDYRDRNESFDVFAAVVAFTMDVTLTGSEEPERIPLGLSTGNLFTALEVKPALGRTFSQEESAPGGPSALLLSYGCWERRFGGSPDIVGQTVNVNGSPVPVVGVLPADFHFIFDADAWLAVADGGPLTGVRRYHNWYVVGRLKDGIALSTAQAEADVISSQLEATYPDSNKGKALALMDLHQGMVKGYRQRLFLLMGAVSLVLLIVCANVASLLTARGSARATEMAVRTALGAGRGRLVRHLLTESLILAVVGGGLGVVAAAWLQNLILRFIPLQSLGLTHLGLSTSMVVFAVMVSLATALVFGTAPALTTTRVVPAQAMREGRAGATTGGTRFRNGLVVFQVAVSVVLLIGSALLIRSLARLVSVDPGFRADGLLTAQVPLGAKYMDADARLRFFTDLRESIEALPGVQGVAFADRLPIRSPGNNVPVWAPERPPANSAEYHYAFQRIVTPGYFRTMGIPVLEGREFDNTDVAGAPPAIIVTKMTADTLFPGETVLGRRVAVDLGNDQPALFDVVGVVADQHFSDLESPQRLAMFFPYDQRRAFTMDLAVRVRGNPTDFIRPIQQRLWALDRDVPLSDPRPMKAVLASSVSGLRVMTAMLGLFSATALGLAVLGLYGILAYFVSSRTHEIGVRVALGASGPSVARLILRQGMALVVLGLVLGVAGALGASRLLADLLFQTGAVDPGTYAGAGFLVFAVAMGACLVPAWRAVGVDPVVALGRE